MTQSFKTLVVAAAQAPIARQISASLSPAGEGMFVVGLRPNSGDETAPPTHYISTGWIDAQFAALLDLNDAQALYDASSASAARRGLPVTWTVDDCATLLESSDVSDEKPHASSEGQGALARLGLQIHVAAEEEDVAILAATDAAWYVRAYQAVKGVIVKAAAAIGIGSTT